MNGEVRFGYGGSQPRLIRGDRSVTSLGELMQLDPLPAPVIIARAIDHLHGEGLFPPMLEAPPADTPRWESEEFGDFSLEGIQAPTWESDRSFVYYASHGVTGIPYRVHAQRADDGGWEIRFDPMPALPEPEPPST